MAYRVVLAVMLVLAVALTLNERWQEIRSQRNAPSLSAAPGSSGDAAGSGPMLGAIPPGVASDLSAGDRSRATPPFLPHRVRTNREIELLSAPRSEAPPVQGVSQVPTGVLVQATEEQTGWYRVETAMSRGWAPKDAFDEP